MLEQIDQQFVTVHFSGSKEELSDEAELLFTRNMRVELIRQYTKDGKIPDQPVQAEVLLHALKDMDSSTFTRMKIKSNEKNTETIANSAALVAEALKQINGNTGKITVLEDIAQRAAVPELPMHLKRNDFIGGELDQGTVNTTYEEFIKNTPPSDY